MITLGVDLDCDVGWVGARAAALVEGWKPSFPGEALVPRLGVGGGFGVGVDAAGFGGLVGED